VAPPGLGGWALNATVLVLNQNYEPLNVCGVRRAFLLLLRDKAQVLEIGEGELRGASAVYEIPGVIRLLYMVKRPVFTRRLSRREVFWRDRFTCQYCGQQSRELTLDHVRPRVHQGPHTWENVVAACVRCNHRKAGRTPTEAGMQLLREPAAPRANPYYHLMHRQLPDEWSLYLPWRQPARRAAALA
jgi:5-methylcytosine-specific restriction endonuclease McrA